jgi:DNA invertase Pin-like site-specific DNA recombinase
MPDWCLTGVWSFSTRAPPSYPKNHYLRISTEEQELDNQRGEIIPFIERRGWKLILPFEDVMSGQKTEKDRPGFAAMLKAAHQRKFDIVVFWALDRLTREGDARQAGKGKNI